MTLFEAERELKTWHKVFCYGIDKDAITIDPLRQAEEQLLRPSKTRRERLLDSRNKLLTKAYKPYHFAVNMYCAAVWQGQLSTVPEYLFWMKHYIRQL